MKIINLETFLNLPNGTLYTKYESYDFGEIRVKEDSLNELDCVYAPLLDVDSDNTGDMMDILDKSRLEGINFNIDVDYTSRDASYNKSQLFAVYEKKDVEQLLNKIQDSLNRAY